MLKLAKRAQFTAQAQIWIAGEEKPESFAVTFKYLTKKEWDSLAEESDSNKDKGFALPQIIIDWHDVCDENGNQIPYTKENLDTILDLFPSATGDIINCYVRELFASRIKN